VGHLVSDDQRYIINAVFEWKLSTASEEDTDAA
jgi:hypothetical protein